MPFGRLSSLLLTLSLSVFDVVVSAAARKPNVVLVFTDDQDLLFDSTKALPFASDFIGAQGVTRVTENSP